MTDYPTEPALNTTSIVDRITKLDYQMSSFLNKVVIPNVGTREQQTIQGTTPVDEMLEETDLYDELKENRNQFCNIYGQFKQLKDNFSREQLVQMSF